MAKDTSPDVVITEIGGTVGDIESLPFLEAIRQFRKDVGRRDVAYIHVTLVPYIRAAGELKTKPTQHSVKELRSIGIQPDILVCRSEKPLPEGVKEKMSGFCDVSANAVITSRDASTIYEVPLILEQEGLAERVVEILDMETRQPDLTRWSQWVERLKHPSRTVRVAIVGKYVQLGDAYLSVVESLRIAAVEVNAELECHWVDSEDIEARGAADFLAEMDGIVVPGGFGSRGVDGKVAAIRYAREQGIPFLGLCLGMQTAVIEWARNVAQLPDANSAEFNDQCASPVIHLLPEQQDVVDLGGTMRLGLYPCKLLEGSLAHRLYGEEVVYERHRHRYEFNNAFRQAFLASGYQVSGTSPDGRLVEIVELPDHPFFIACQFHPEFDSRPNQPNPLFLGLVRAAVGADAPAADVPSLSEVV